MKMDFFKKNTFIQTKKSSTPTQKRAAINAQELVPKLVVNGKSKPINRKLISIGRGKENQIVVADIKVSRQHALIKLEKNEYYLIDTGSTNATYLNDNRIPSGKKVKLKNGDKIKVGQTVLNFRY